MRRPVTFVLLLVLPLELSGCASRKSAGVPPAELKQSQRERIVAVTTVDGRELQRLVASECSLLAHRARTIARRPEP
jgi:type IV pilus biogenesis protein CpaD/CtpE